MYYRHHIVNCTICSDEIHICSKSLFDSQHVGRTSINAMEKVVLYSYIFGDLVFSVMGT